MVVTRSRAQFWNKLVPSPPKMVPSPPKMVPSPPKMVPSPKSTEQKLQEALAEIASLKKMNASLTKEFVEYMNERTRIIADKIGEVWDAKRKIKELEEELKISQARK